VPHVKPVAVKDGEVGVPATDPFSSTRYPVTPMLSVDADHEIPNEPLVDAVCVRLLGAVGAAVSGQAFVVASSEAFPERFPAPSTASTSNRYDVPHESPVAAYDVEAVEPSIDPLRYTP
jgi:hypothetical protein